MYKRIIVFDELPESCHQAKKTLPIEIQETILIDQIIIEVYNSCQGHIGASRVDEICKMINESLTEYAKALDLTVLEVFETFSKVALTGNFYNWYQLYIPFISDIMVFEDENDFNKRFPLGLYQCPNCKGLSFSRYECTSGVTVNGGQKCYHRASFFLDKIDYKPFKILFKSKFKKYPLPESIFKPLELISII